MTSDYCYFQENHRSHKRAYFIAERREQQRQTAIRQFVKRCEALYEQQRKEEFDAVTKKQTTYRIRAPTGKSITPTLKTEYRRAADT